MAHDLLYTSFNRTYNPNKAENNLKNIKKLLTSRDTVLQNEATALLIKVIDRCNKNSNEGSSCINYLLDNDIIFFLCEAISNLDWSVFKCVLKCIRLIWREKRFFSEEHGAHALEAVLRTWTHYAASGMHVAVDTCLHFLCDLFTGIQANKVASPLSYDSPYSVEQVLACLNTLKVDIIGKRPTILGVALVLSSLIAYQPENLKIRAESACVVARAVETWLPIFIESLKRVALVGKENDTDDMFYIVICGIGIDLVRLCSLLTGKRPKSDLVQTILMDNQEEAGLKQSSDLVLKCLHNALLELVYLTQENRHELRNEEYGKFLDLLYRFLSENWSLQLSDFCDVLCRNDYLSLLPQMHFYRNHKMISKTSTLVLGQMLVHLSRKYLNIEDYPGVQTYSEDIERGLVELRSAIEQPQAIGSRLQISQPYCVLVFLYFYCQYTKNPLEDTAPLLPDLIQYVMRIPKTCYTPKYTIKAFWLIFAMASLSTHDTTQTIHDRVLLEKGTNRLLDMLIPNPSMYYTHNPAILLWCFTTNRITKLLGPHVLRSWLEIEDSIPTELLSEPLLKYCLVIILEKSESKITLMNAANAINLCVREMSDEEKQEFAKYLWDMIPRVLSKQINASFESQQNCRHLLQLIAEMPPINLEPNVCTRTAHLISGLYAKSSMENYNASDDRLHFEYVCLKLSFELLEWARSHHDIRVLRIYSNNADFLRCVLTATRSAQAQLACTALEVLSQLVHCCNLMQYKPEKRLEVDTSAMIRTLRTYSNDDARELAFTQLLYIMLKSSTSPLTLSDEMQIVEESRTYSSLKGLMFRVQMMCCKESGDQSTSGWQTLSAIFNHAASAQRNDNRLIVMLTTQPWTHTLIRYQSTKTYTKEFLIFAKSWLKAFKITYMVNGNKNKKVLLHKNSLFYGTLISLKKKIHLSVDEQCSDMKCEIVSAVEYFLRTDDLPMSLYSQKFVN